MKKDIDHNPLQAMDLAIDKILADEHPVHVMRELVARYERSSDTDRYVYVTALAARTVAAHAMLANAHRSTTQDALNDFCAIS